MNHASIWRLLDLWRLFQAIIQIRQKLCLIIGLSVFTSFVSLTFKHLWASMIVWNLLFWLLLCIYVCVIWLIITLIICLNLQQILIISSLWIFQNLYISNASFSTNNGPLRSIIHTSKFMMYYTQGLLD